MINIFKKFKDGLKKTTSNFSKGIKEIIINKEIGDKELEKNEVTIRLRGGNLVGSFKLDTLSAYISKKINESREINLNI